MHGNVLASGMCWRHGARSEGLATEHMLQVAKVHRHADQSTHAPPRHGAHTAHNHAHAHAHIHTSPQKKHNGQQQTKKKGTKVPDAKRVRNHYQPVVAAEHDALEAPLLHTATRCGRKGRHGRRRLGRRRHVVLAKVIIGLFPKHHNVFPCVGLSAEDCHTSSYQQSAVRWPFVMAAGLARVWARGETQPSNRQQRRLSRRV